MSLFAIIEKQEALDTKLSKSKTYIIIYILVCDLFI